MSGMEMLWDPSPGGYAASLGMVLSTNRKNRALRAPATKIKPLKAFRFQGLCHFSTMSLKSVVEASWEKGCSYRRSPLRRPEPRCASRRRDISEAAIPEIGNGLPRVRDRGLSLQTKATYVAQ